MYGNLQLSGSEHYGPCLAIGALGYDCVVIIVSRDAKLSSAIDTRVHTDAVSHNHITQFRYPDPTGVFAISVYCVHVYIRFQVLSKPVLNSHL